MILQILLGIAGGAGVPVQTCMNNNLNKRLWSPFRALLISSGMSLVLMTAFLFVGRVIPFSFSALKGEPLWIWCGGLFGICYMAGNILLFSRAGSSIGVVMPVCGQIFMGLIIDHFGLFSADRRPLTAAKAAGGALLLIGMFLVALGRQQAVSGGRKGKAQWKDAFSGGIAFWYLIGILGGMSSACQIAVNGRAGRLLGTPFKGVMLSLITSTVALAVICCVQTVTGIGLADKRDSEPGPGPGRRVWIWFGGSLGLLYVAVNTYLVNIFGSGLTLTLGLLGSVCASAVIDHFALLTAERARLNATRLTGLALLFAGAALIRLW